MPLEMRSLVLQKPETVLQIASNLYARRMLAEQALAAGLDKDPQVIAALRVARDKVLSDARLEQIDKKTTPADNVAEGLALNSYRAKQDRFKVGEEVRIRHILISEVTPESRAKAEKILADLKSGADFAAVAKEHSADKGSAEKGGDLGYFMKGRMVPEFEAASFSLKNKGDLSDIVQTSFGYHILKLDDRREPRVRAFSEVKDELMKEVRSTVTQEARAVEAQKIEQSAKINKEAVESFASRYKKPQ
ncbi:MAG: peptidylprolyl isomerase [Rhizobacter sp.]